MENMLFFYLSNGDDCDDDDKDEISCKKPAVTAVDYELVESLVEGVDTFNDKIDRRRPFSFPSFGDEKERFEDSAGADDQFPLRNSEGKGGPCVGLVIFKKGLEDWFQVEDGVHVGKCAVPARAVGVFQLEKLDPKLSALGFQLLICKGGGGVR